MPDARPRDRFVVASKVEDIVRSGGFRAGNDLVAEVSSQVYIELLPPEAAEPLGVDVGDCFIALHSEQAEGVQWLADRMSALHPESHPRVQLRELVQGDDNVPWFHCVNFDYDSGTSGLGAWALEYHREFKHRMAPSIYTEPGDISRRRGAPPVAHHPDKLLRDIDSVEIAVPESRSAQLATLFTVVGLAHGNPRRRNDMEGRGFRNRNQGCSRTLEARSTEAPARVDARERRRTPLRARPVSYAPPSTRRRGLSRARPTRSANELPSDSLEVWPVAMYRSAHPHRIGAARSRQKSLPRIRALFCERSRRIGKSVP